MKLWALILALSLSNPLLPSAHFKTCSHLNPVVISFEVNCTRKGNWVWADIHWDENGMILAERGVLPMTLKRTNPDGTFSTYVQHPMEPQFSLDQLYVPGHHQYRGVCYGNGDAAELRITLLLKRIDGFNCYDIRGMEGPL